MDLNHEKLMKEVNDAFKEEPISPKLSQLKIFAENIKKKGFNFDPREISKLVDNEAKRQYQEMFDTCFKGQHLDVLTSAKDETIAWFQAEEVRFEAFKNAWVSGPDEMMKDIPTPVIEATKKGKKK